MSKPCTRTASTALDTCLTCGAHGDEACPYDDLTVGLSPVPTKATVIGGDCSGEDGVCESCQ
jgi:hypothetical protein